MTDDEPVDQITDLLRGVDNLCFDVLHTEYRVYGNINEYVFKEGGIDWFNIDQ